MMVMQNLQQRIRAALRDTFLHNMATMFIATSLAGVFNYLYLLFMGRLMPPESYGVFGALYAFFYVLYILVDVIQTSIARFTAEAMAKGKPGLVNFIVTGMLKTGAIFAFVPLIACIAMANYITSFLQMDSSLPVIMLGFAIFFSMLLPILLGSLQGLCRFNTLGLVMLLNAGFKLLLGIVFVWLGFDIAGALGAIGVAALLSIAASITPLRSLLNFSGKSDFRLTQVYKYAAPATLLLLCYSVPTSIDVIIVKHFFTPYEAGIFTAASVIGKIVFFFPIAVSVVMFPNVSGQHTQKKDTTNILKMCLIYTAFLSGLVALAFWVLPTGATRFFFGESYLRAASLARWYVVAMFFFSLTTIYIRYNLAIKNWQYLMVILPITILEIILITFIHSSMNQVVYILMGVNIALFATSCGYMLLAGKRLRHVAAYSPGVRTAQQR